MKTITVKEALKQGYTLCGYEDLEMQGLKNIDNLEEEIITLRHTLQADEDALKKVAEQNVILNKNFELLLKEKRSDIIKNYEQELLALKQNEELLLNDVTDLKMTKTKLASKIEELIERVNRAESELKQRDEIELKQVRDYRTFKK